VPLLAFGYQTDNHTTRPPRRRRWDAVYSDASLNTQIDDGTGDLTKGEGLASSSCSAPGVVWVFLEELRLEDHIRVLEIGTGTGWTAGLAGRGHERHQHRNSTRLDPRRLVADSEADLAIAAPVPGVQTRLYYGEGDQADECTFWILDRNTREGSWASMDHVPGRGSFVVRQYGDRHL
jgi:hypothetical protein